MSLTETLISTTVVVIVCIGCIGLGIWKRIHLDSGLRYVWIFCVVGALDMTISSWMANHGIHTTIFRRCTMVVTASVLFLFYYTHLPRITNLVRAAIIVIGFLLVMLIHFLNADFVEAEQYKYSFLARAYLDIIVTLLVFLHLHHLLNTPNELGLERRPEFWVSVAWLFMYAGKFIPEIGTVYLFSLEEYVASPHARILSRVIGAAMMLVGYLLILFGFSRYRKPIPNVTHI